MGISINTVNVIGAKYDMQTKTLADESWSELEKICNILGYPFACEDEEMHLSNVDIYDEFCPAYIEEQVLCHFDIDIICSFSIYNPLRRQGTKGARRYITRKRASERTKKNI